MRQRAIALAVAAGALGVACDGPREGKNEAHAASLGGEVASRVGADAIPLALVAEIAKSQGLDAKAAADRAVTDAVIANGARERGLDAREPTAWRLRSARAQLLVARTFDEAKSRGLPTDDEVRALTERHWVEFDRPPSVRVMHAIVLRQAKEAALEPKARRLAERVHAAVVDATDDDFEAKARAVRDPAGGKLEIRVERLPAFTEKGLVVEGPGAMDPVFSKAAFALPKAGATSDVVESPFGFHVIRLVERLPEARTPFEQRRLAFADEVYTRRAREALESRLNALRAARPVTISPAAEPLMRGIAVAAAASAQ